MGIDTLTFSFLFLPASMLVFYAAPSRYKNTVLAMVSLLFYALNDLEALPLLLFSVFFDFFACSKMVRSTGEMKGRKVVFAASVLKNIVMMVVAMAIMELKKVPVPLGLLVYNTTSLGYVIDVYNGDERFDGNFIDYLLFTSFFGKLNAGPIVRYSDLKAQWENRDLSFPIIKKGMKKYISGLAKLVILARGNITIQTAIKGFAPEESSVMAVWLLVITSTFAFYYTLTGYCDMAQGLGNFFGMEFPENFHYPFQSRTVEDFFNRFNITLTQFINRYVYVFLGADTNGVLPTILNTLLTTLLMGLWFGIRLNYLVWGIYFTAFILLEKYFLMKYLQKIPPVFDRLYTFIIVMFSFTIFSGQSLPMTGGYLMSMFGLNGLPFINNHISYILSSYFIIILMDFFFATSLSMIVEKHLRSKAPRLTGILDTVASLGVFALTLIFMV